jgi:cytochrome P450
VLWSAANRDPGAFPRPDDVDVDRENPRQHLSFGNGLHFCIGAPLARLESRVALEALLRSTSAFHLAAPARHLPNLMVRRVQALPLELQPAGR